MAKKKAKEKVKVTKYQFICYNSVEYTLVVKETKDVTKYFLEDTANPHKKKGKPPIVARAKDDGNTMRIQMKPCLYETKDKDFIEYHKAVELHLLLKGIMKHDKRMSAKYSFIKVK